MEKNCLGGTRYTLGWGGAARPLIPWPCLRQISLIFLPCSRQNSDFWYPVKAFIEQAVYRSRKDTLFKTKNDKIDTPFKTQIPKKHTLAGRTSPLSPYKGVPPPGENLCKSIFRPMGQFSIFYPREEMQGSGKDLDYSQELCLYFILARAASSSLDTGNFFSESRWKWWVLFIHTFFGSTLCSIDERH